MACISNEKRQEIIDSTQGLKSRRARILTGLKCLLETVLKSNGYCHDVCEVSFNVNAWRDNLEGGTPIIYIVDDTVNRIERKAGRQRQYYWKVLLFGVVKGFDIIEFEQHIADVEQAIEDNTDLAGIVSQMEVDVVTTDNQLFSEKEDTHLYEIALEIRYIRCHGDPR